VYLPRRLIRRWGVLPCPHDPREIGTVSRFDPFPVLRTDRLVLRAIGPSDVDVMVRLHADPAVLRYLGRPARTRDQVVARIADEVAMVARGEAIRWAFDLDGAMVGSGGFWRWNPAHHLAEIGYDLLPEQWGRGLVVEALRPILRYGFEHLGLHRVEANIDPANAASARVLDKLGFVREGTQRENWFYAGAYTDTGVYGLLASDLR